MTQRTQHFPSPKALYAENKQLFIMSGAEVVVLEDVPSIGYNKFALTISNSALYSDTVTIVNIYGSEDKLNYYIYKSNVFSGGIGSGSTMHYEFVATINYLKITIQSTGLVSVDTYLIANSGSTNSTGGGGGGTPGSPGTGTVQAGLVQFVNTDTASVVLSLSYADTNYVITLTCGSNVLAYYDESSKTTSGFTIYTSAPFTGEVSYEVAYP